MCKFAADRNFQIAVHAIGDKAIEIFTEGGAYQSFEEDIKGDLAEVKLADFIVIDKDIRAIAKNKIKDIQVLETYVGGKLVYQK